MWQEAAVAVRKSPSAGKNDAHAFAADRNGAIRWQRQWRWIKSHHTGTAARPTFYAKSIHNECEAYFAGVGDDSYIIRDKAVEELFEMILNTRCAKGVAE